MPTEKRVPSLIVNTLTEAQYQALENPSDTEMWVTPYDESILPSQTGQSGKFLTTDGTDASWATVDTLPSQSGQSGKFLTTDGTDASWSAVDALPSQTGQSGKFLTTNGTDASWATVNALQNTATGTGSLTILGSNASGAYSTNIGVSSVARIQGTSVGSYSRADDYSVAVGKNAQSSASFSTVIGSDSTCSASETVVIGPEAQATVTKAMAIGRKAVASAASAIQIGEGTNSTANSVQIDTYQVFDRSTGKIPAARMPITVADTSLSNLTAAGKDIGAELSFPVTNSYTNLVLGASGATYTAAYNGYLVFEVSSTNANLAYVTVGQGDMRYQQVWFANGVVALFPGGAIPITKGTFQINYGGIAGMTSLRLFYNQGNNPS